MTAARNPRLHPVNCGRICFFRHNSLKPINFCFFVSVLGEFMKTFVLAAVLASIAVSAQSATIQMERNGVSIGSVDCGASACQGWDGSGWSNTVAALEFIYNDKGKVSSDEKAEEAWVSNITGEPFTSSNKGGSVGPANSLAAYVLFKFGGGSKLPSNGLLRNVSGGPITYAFTQAPGGNGLSHTNSFGTIPQTPLPASGILLGAALLGAGVAARRRRKA